jgi:hypothetical protein
MLLAILILLPSSICSQQFNSINIEDKMIWFQEAKLGILFIGEFILLTE